MADPFLDALGVADPSAPKPAASTSPLPKVSYTDPTDAAVRTVYAEASAHPEERKWVAAVIANRAKAGKKGFDQVVQEPGQFEPWSTAEGRQKMAALDPNSDDYKQIKALVDPVLAGKEDPSGGATSFYAPKAQAALGRPKPDFDDGSGVDVGQTRFFGGKGQAPDDFLSAVGADKSKAEAASTDKVDLSAAGVVPYRGLEGKDSLTGPQTKAYTAENKGGLYDPNAAPGSERNKFYVQAGADEKDVPAGAYYVDRSGQTKRAPGGPHESSVTAGLGQGLGDVVTGISHLLPGSDDSAIKNALIAEQANYGAKYGGDAASGAGRFTGQVLASAPILAAGEAAAAPVLARAGQAGEFLAGQAGKAMPAGVARFLTRGASLAAQGARTGAGAAGLTSSANEGSLGQQMAEGAAGGAVLGPVAPAIEGTGGAVARGVKGLVEPMTAKGPAAIANRIVGKFARGAIGDANAGEIVPGSVPTLATASADPGLATLERTVRLGPHGDLFAARDAANHQARADFFEKLKGDEDSVQALKDARDAATSNAREAALKGQTQPADVQPVLDTIDAILKGPEGKRTEVVKALKEVRDNLHDAAGNPETSAEMLYGVRKGIGDLLSPKASSDKSGAKLAASQLGDVKTALDAAIQKVAPGFKEYLKDYSELSKPIDEQQVLQGLKIADMRGNITLAKAQAALDKISAMRAKPGSNPAKSVSEDTVAALTAIRDDLKRGDNINLARAIGPDTAQHFSTGGRLQQAGIPAGVGLAIAHHPVGAAAIGAGRLLYGLKDKQIMAEVANRLLNPEAPASPAVLKAKDGLLKRLAGPVPAAVGGMMANRLVPAQ